MVGTARPAARQQPSGDRFFQSGLHPQPRSGVLVSRQCAGLAALVFHRAKPRRFAVHPLADVPQPGKAFVQPGAGVHSRRGLGQCDRPRAVGQGDRLPRLLHHPQRPAVALARVQSGRLGDFHRRHAGDRGRTPTRSPAPVLTFVIGLLSAGSIVKVPHPMAIELGIKPHGIG